MASCGTFRYASPNLTKGRLATQTLIVAIAVEGGEMGVMDLTISTTSRAGASNSSSPSMKMTGGMTCRFRREAW